LNGMALSSDLTLDELRHALAGEVAAAAVFDGWSKAAIDHAANVMGADRAIARVAFADGRMAMIEAWIGTIDQAMTAAFSEESLAGLPVRERIRQLVEFRLDALAGREEAVSRALAIMAMPGNAARAIRLGWRSADAMWRLAGDRSTDSSHYTRRMILASLYAATLGVFVQDASEGKADTRAFLGRRIEDVIRFEKTKARWRNNAPRRFSLARFLGRLRYPQGHG